MRHDLDAQPISEQQIALVRTAEPRDGDDGRARNAISRLTCGLPLNSEHLLHAVSGTVTAFPLLRSSFDLLADPGPQQLLHGEAGCEPSVVDLRTIPAVAQNRAVEDAVHALAQRPFDLSRAPLLRIAAFHLSDSCFELVVVSHPALIDRRSQRTLLTEIVHGYLALRTGVSWGHPASSASEVPPPRAVPAPSSAFSDDVAHWSEEFADFTAPDASYWITPPGSADEQSPASAVIREVDLDDGLVKRLAEVADSHGASLAEVVLAVHAKATAVATGRTDFAIGIEQDRWASAETHPIGIATATLAARIKLVPGSWASALAEVRRATEAAAAYAHLSHQRLQKVVNVGHLLDTNFVYSETALEAALLGGPAGELSALPVDAGSARSPFDGTLQAEVFHNTTTKKVRLRLTAGPGLAPGQLDEVRQLHLRAFEACAAGHQLHQDAELLPAHHLSLTLGEWNGLARPYRLDQPVHHLIEQQVRKTPDEIAVVDSDVALTYQELNSRANRLAHRLRALGVDVGSVVGVYGRRDAGLLIAFLGVLKAGAAYLPLDPKQPADRVAHMLRDAQVDLVLSDSTYANAVPSGSWEVLRTDDPSTTEGLPDTDLGPTSCADDLMYVIYTSGSTGQPKGVEVPHRGVANFLQCGVETFGADRTGGAPVFSSVAFDMVVSNLYVPLLMGQRVCMISESLDLFQIAERLRELAPFAFIKLTPGQLDTFAELIPAQEARCLAGMLVVGADAFPVRTLRHWRRLDPETPILNEYGPTEASVGNTLYRTDGTEQGDLLPIGRPIPNTTMYVLDDHGAPAPIGVPGHLYIGGACVVRGYANRPDLTAERFVEDHLDQRYGPRMYRTGDIGRWLPSGALEFLGRIDDQLKIRGYRVAPAEVETTMVRHPAVTEAVVVGVGARRETHALAGYYVTETGLPPEELRSFLSGILPDYLVPSFLIPIREVPLNRNGKVDRAALPAPGRHRSELSRRQSAAAGPVGQTVERLWRRAHGSAPEGIDAQVAGPDCDLIASTRLAAAVSREFALPLASALAMVDRSSTFGQLCEELLRVAPAHAADEHTDTPATAEPGFDAQRGEAHR
ncbi:amino acid adenylation domain-containing protein [Streptomyces cellulosae]|uniref:Amino acid adenylation domain-containing protein n=1 Tax=Streptomyces althioticus TaxID=83380 RepID=A0ABZ1YIE6_9ACTN|nr:amino acid adenylation domain-containing protein [Streptomyces cellulosae]WTB93349.1 amino acid adenylation domain-containing protein [Streptomyces cellulosae]WTC60741.1 amino acid adenylation domain-containing protein [Streptomyces cellulosae]